MLQIKYQDDGLVPAIVQDRHTGKVLMLGYMNADAYQQTLVSGFVTFIAARARSCGRKVKPPVTV